jgi:hypothetical protein
MFLTVPELNTHLYAEIVDTISEANDDIPSAAIAAAIDEAKGYMSRYDTAALFAAEGTERHNYLLLIIKDIACWHFIILSNPGIDWESRKVRYDAAIKWLQGVQMGKIIPEGFPIKEPTERQSYFQFGSNERRGSHY